LENDSTLAGDANKEKLINLFKSMQVNNDRNNFAVIFDMDGVIVDSNPFHKKALLQFCRKYGFNLTEKEMKTNVFGRTNKEWLTNLFGNISLEKLKQLEDEKEALFREMYLPFIRPVKGLIRFLDMLKEKRIRIAIATSAPKSNVDFTLLQTGIADYFQTIIDGDSIINSKPHPEIYLKTTKQLGYSPNNCVVIEDSISGIEAAKKAGGKVVGITTTHTKNELNNVDLIIENFEGLKLEELNKLFL